MLTKVQKLGNSLVIKIPRSLAVEAQIAKGSLVELSLINGQIDVKRAPTPKWTLEELMAAVTEENRHAEIGLNDSL